MIYCLVVMSQNCVTLTFLLDEEQEELSNTDLETARAASEALSQYRKKVLLLDRPNKLSKQKLIQ